MPAGVLRAGASAVLQCSELLARWGVRRAGETRMWEAMRRPVPAEGEESLRAALRSAKAAGAEFVLLGLPEDVGPRANLGRGGATGGWEAFVSRFANLQANAHFQGDDILFLGEVDLRDIQRRAAAAADATALRALCAEVDAAVEPVLREVFTEGLHPIVIGGGHNNCLPILRALAGAAGRPAVACNLDPHADFRDAEGRHSGNGFRYAYEEGILKDYHVMALHEQKNNQASLAALEEAGFTYDSYQALRVRKEKKFGAALAAARARLDGHGAPLGVEVDTDVVSHMPVSAFTNTALSVEKAEQFVWQMAAADNARYLHLCEAAPAQHPAGAAQGMNEAGQVLAALVSAYIAGRRTK